MSDQDDTHKMLRTIINGQSAFRQEILGRMDRLDRKIEGVEERLTQKIDGVEKRLTVRMDKIGKQLSYLEDDTPTREEFDKLEKRVDKIEHKHSQTL